MLRRPGASPTADGQPAWMQVRVGALTASLGKRNSISREPGQTVKIILTPCRRSRRGSRRCGCSASDQSPNEKWLSRRSTYTSAAQPRDTAVLLAQSVMQPTSSRSAIIKMVPMLETCAIWERIGSRTDSGGRGRGGGEEESGESSDTHCE